jgi:ABC-type phosphate transport system substrate-binding protein
MNNSRMKGIAMTVGALTIGIIHVAMAVEIVVIVNPKNTLAKVTGDQIEQIFLGKSTALPGGAHVSLVDQADDSALRDEFYQKATGRSKAQVQAIWARLVFSGRGLPPKVLGSSAEVKKFVASNPDAIGYIEKSEANESVKIVLALP